MILSLDDIADVISKGASVLVSIYIHTCRNAHIFQHAEVVAHNK